MATIRIEGQLISSAESRQMLLGAAIKASALVTTDYDSKARGAAGANGVRWSKLTQKGLHARAAKTTGGRSVLRLRQNLTERERRLLAPYRGTRRLPTGSDPYNTRLRRNIIGHEVCNTSEYRAIKSQRADLRQSMSALELNAAQNPVGVSSGALRRSFIIGQPGCRLELSDSVATLESTVAHAAAFDAKREIIPPVAPREWVEHLTEEYFHGSAAFSG